MIVRGKSFIQTILQSSKLFLRPNVLRTMSTDIPSDDVFFEENEKAGIIVLNRPKDMNSINLVMVHSMTRQLEVYEKYKSHVILKSAVPGIFSAGGDIVAISTLAQKNDKISMYILRYGYALNYTVGSLKIPHVALVDGIVMGGGAGLACLGKYKVCTENTIFAMPEVKIGIFPDAGASYYLTRLNNHLGFYFGMTGVRLKGYDNVFAGVSTHYCESAKLPELEKELRMTDDVEGTLNSFCSKPANSQFSLEPCLEKIDRIFSSQTVEEIVAKLEEDGSPWAKKTSSIIGSLSPLSLKATLYHLHINKNATLEECVQRDYVLADTLWSNNHNMVEGLRAFKDKNRKPKWIPSTLQEVTPQMIEDMYKVRPHLGPIDLKPVIRG